VARRSRSPHLGLQRDAGHLGPGHARARHQRAGGGEVDDERALRPPDERRLPPEVDVRSARYTAPWARRERTSPARHAAFKRRSGWGSARTVVGGARWSKSSSRAALTTGGLHGER